jgi:hypothetical protein
MLRTPKQNARLHQLLTKLNIDAELKQEMVYTFTDGRTKSSKELEYREATNLIKHLERSADQVKVPYNAPDKTADRMRKKFLSVCHNLGWVTSSGLDWKHINDWLLKYGYLHKSLNNYTTAELPGLITQIEKLSK